MSMPPVSALIPAQAFREAYPYRLLPGAVFLFRSFWAIRVAYSDSKTDQAFLILQGPNAGQLHRVGEGMARSLSLADPFTWFAVLDPSDPAEVQSMHSASLAIGEKGPVVVGGDSDGDHYAFYLNGQPWDDYRAQVATVRFDRWSAHLSLEDRPFSSLGPIFAVDRRRGQVGT